MSLTANKAYHDMQAHRFADDGDRAWFRQEHHREPVAHVFAYYQRRHRAHRAAWTALVIAVKDEA